MSGACRIENCPDNGVANTRKQVLEGYGFAVTVLTGPVNLAISVVDQSDPPVPQDVASIQPGPIVLVATKAH